MNDTKPINALKAREYAVSCLSNCFSSEEAGGFESGQNSDSEWLPYEPEIVDGTQTVFGFIMNVGGHRIKISASIVRDKK